MCGAKWALAFIKYTVVPLITLTIAPYVWNIVGLSLNKVGSDLEPTMQSSSVFLAAKPPAAAGAAWAPLRVNSLYTSRPPTPTTTTNDPNSMAAAGPKWAQKTITLPPQRRGCHLITPKADKRSLSLTGSNASRNYSSELQRVFNYFDEDGDGKISPSELQSCVRTVGGELSIDEAEAAVRTSDLNGDGQLDFEEFRKLMDTGGEEDKKEELREAFGMYEMEGSGCITPTSLKRMLNRLGESKSTEDCKAMIRMFDLNGDGVLSFDEFRIMMR
ncbi:calcium-binding protein cml38 [Quercus suber]|uniref:Calcium-binding protein cml38 n=1 Tax=Quercus suber TaxID=58331 RepID=A0AAW0JP85_QUESU